MDRLAAGVYAALSGDSTLTATLGATITQGRIRQDPKLLTKPQVCFKLAGGPDRTGFHGASVEARVEVKVWGHEDARGAGLRECLAVAARVDLVLLPFLSTTTPAGSPDGGGTNRPQANPGWQQIDDTDPMVIHLHNGYDMLYWSAQRVAAL